MAGRFVPTLHKEAIVNRPDVGMRVLSAVRWFPHRLGPFDGFLIGLARSMRGLLPWAPYGERNA